LQSIIILSYPPLVTTTKNPGEPGAKIGGSVMKDVTNISLQDLELSVNLIFERQQKQTELECQKAALAAEEGLFQHLMLALHLIQKGGM